MCRHCCDEDEQSSGRRTTPEPATAYRSAVGGKRGGGVCVCVKTGYQYCCSVRPTSTAMGDYNGDTTAARTGRTDGRRKIESEKRQYETENRKGKKKNIKRNGNTKTIRPRVPNTNILFDRHANCRAYVHDRDGANDVCPRQTP